MDLDPEALSPRWEAFTDEKMRLEFEVELRREIPNGHVLDGAELRAIARRYDRDDALFALHDGRWAIVHLTWSESPSNDARWPVTSLAESKADVDALLARDAID